MTYKIKLVFLVITTTCTLFVMLSTPFAVDMADRLLSAVANALNLHEAPAYTALALLVIPVLYFAFRQKRHS